MNNIYISLKANTYAIKKENYEALPVDSSGLKTALGIPDGTQLEIVNFQTGKIESYCEAINEKWFER